MTEKQKIRNQYKVSHNNSYTKLLNECKKYKEIAEILGVSVNTVKTHISLGLKILRKEFPASLLFAFFSLRRLR